MILFLHLFRLLNKAEWNVCMLFQSYYFVQFSNVVLSVHLLALRPNIPHFQVLMSPDSSHFIFPWNHLAWRSAKLSYLEEWIPDLKRPWKIPFFSHSLLQAVIQQHPFKPLNSSHHNRCPVTSFSESFYLDTTTETRNDYLAQKIRHIRKILFFLGMKTIYTVKKMGEWIIIFIDPLRTLSIIELAFG